MLEYLRRLLAELTVKRAALKTDAERVVAAAETEQRKLTDDEKKTIDGALDAIRGVDQDITATEARIAEIEQTEERATRAAAAAAAAGQTGEQRERNAGGAQVTDPDQYAKGGQRSYFRDIMRAQMLGDHQAADRLRRNDQAVNADLHARALTTTDGAGGEFVPPLWMIQEYITLARAGRITADRLRQLPLPPGTDTISLPRIATGTATAEQTSQNTAVQNTDATTNSVSAAVATIAGQQVIAQQLLDQSPVNMDDVLLADLAADYATKLDVFVINNNATNKVGLLNVASAVAVTYTDATPTLAELYPKVADAIQQIHTARLLPADTIVMHPRRWATFLAATDSQGRPLVVPAAGMPMNALAVQNGVASEGLVGYLQGLPVYVDPNIPVTLGGGTEDRILIFRSIDSILYEGTPRSEAFRETKADQLSVLLRFYNYAALHASRYPKSIGVISGTGLVTPVF
ncbi:phage major capsid protein [Cryptosporangium sp. NPDC051539]|uniref:phage major capsid protein n=1 Tax=Cryptosporangium sp. NPDC051539 TaxID=3363962 RepID=UPI0037982682